VGQAMDGEEAGVALLFEHVVEDEVFEILVMGPILRENYESRESSRIDSRDSWFPAFITHHSYTLRYPQPSWAHGRTRPHCLRR